MFERLSRLVPQSRTIDFARLTAPRRVLMRPTIRIETALESRLDRGVPSLSISGHVDGRPRGRIAVQCLHCRRPCIPVDECTNH